MPSEWTMDSLPAPNDADVKLEQVPAKMLAAITWKGGSPKQEKVRREEDGVSGGLTCLEHGKEESGVMWGPEA